MNITKSWGGTTLNLQDIASPCGAVGNQRIIKLILSSMILFSFMAQTIPESQ